MLTRLDLPAPGSMAAVVHGEFVESFDEHTPSGRADRRCRQGQLRTTVVRWPIYVIRYRRIAVHTVVQTSCGEGLAAVDSCCTEAEWSPKANSVAVYPFRSIGDWMPNRQPMANQRSAFARGA